MRVSQVPGAASVAWYADKASFKITARGGESKLFAPSGCQECCEHGAMIHFDVTLDTTYDFVRSDTQSWRVNICANGDVSIIPQ